MTAATSAPVRVIVSKVGLDGHDRGAKVIARGMRDAGMEVIYAGLRRQPDELAEIALQEDADCIGLSILSGAVVPLTRRVVAALEARGMEDVLVVVGGITSPQIETELAEIGVEGVFGPGTPIERVVSFTREQVGSRRSQQGR